jgi:hypothetical protein
MGNYSPKRELIKSRAAFVVVDAERSFGVGFLGRL